MQYKILVVSSYPPSRSAGLAQDMMNALELDGHSVDFFTLYGFAGQKSNQYSIYPKPLIEKLRILKKIFPFLIPFKKLALRLFREPTAEMNTIDNHGYHIPYLYETEPPVDSVTLINNMPDKYYDFLLVYVTERMMTTLSLVPIYDKYKVPILLTCMDMLHFTGGCYFFGDCRRFMEGCGKCPVLDSDDANDQTHKNYLVKAGVFSQIDYAIICNLYQKQFALKCGLYNANRIFNVSIIIDEDVFEMKDKKECKKILGIPPAKEKLILSRYAPGLNRAKGMDHLVNIVNICYDTLKEEEREQYALVLIGANDFELAKHVKMDTLVLGVLDLPNLVRSYNAASVFVSTSIDDAGPSMVNQSMMCGTPVVTFSIGTALEVTREGVNGYMARNFDDLEFASDILKICRMSDEESLRMRQLTHSSALEMNSKSANSKRITEIYEDVLKLKKQ